MKTFANMDMGVVGLSGQFTGLSYPFACYGSFGIIDGNTDVFKNFTTTETGYVYNGDGFTITCKYEEYNDGLIFRTDSFLNTSNKPIIINKYVSRFFFPGFDCDVYTQYSAWQHENMGCWQKLNTQISAGTTAIRHCEGATPMLAIKNTQNNKGVVFHLFPKGAWKMSAIKRPYYDKCDNVVVEMGLNNDNPFSITVMPNESIDFPEIVYYETENYFDFDAYKLHAFFNNKFPRKQLPIIYDTWLSNFTNIEFEDTIKLIDTAKELGFEIFNIDCGWYGDGKAFFKTVGKWYESLEYGYKGRLKEISDYVHKAGMKFGLWFEYERAYEGVQSVKDHPEYYLTSGDNDYFIDYSNDEACDFILNEISVVLKKYNVDYIKTDANRTIHYDPTNQAFFKYYEGYKKFIKKLRKAFPNLYISNCAAGGFRLDLSYQQLMETCWFTDNNGMLEGLSILKNALLRIPSSNIERWGVYTFTAPIPTIGSKTYKQHPLICNNASWQNLATVKEDYIFNFLQGGPLGLSCNIHILPDEHKEKLKNVIAKYKEDREFYRTALTHILLDCDNMLCFEYRDANFDRIEIKLFTKNICLTRVRIYPKVLEGASYKINDKIYSYDEIVNDGIELKDLYDFNCFTLTLEKV